MRRWRRELGCLLAAFVSALVLSAALTLVLPKGAAQLDHVVVATVSFPVLWAGIGLWLVQAAARKRAWTLTLSVTLLALVPVVLQVLG
ncbi:MAG: hypothetical protein AAF411_04615 [Myxococcota bacterium]